MNDEKKQIISDLCDEQKQCVSKLKRLSKQKPAKRLSTSLKRTFKSAALGFRIYNIELQKRIVASQPEIKYPFGAIINENINE